MFNTDSKINKIQHLLFEMLCYLDDFCKKNNIRYFMGGGSCLGAVREGGFIVWDTDIDIMLPRPDYDRLINLYSKMDTDKYGLYNIHTDKSCYNCYSKLYDKHTAIIDHHFSDKNIGIGIDIFPIDGISSNKAIRKLLFAYLKIYYSLILCVCRQEFLPGERFKPVKILVHKLFKNVKIDKHIKNIERIAKSFDYMKSTYAGSYLSFVNRYFGEKEIHEKSIWNDTVYFDFEGRKVPVFGGYHEYLTKHYGNYMIPRDDGKQHSVDEFVV